MTNAEAKTILAAYRPGLDETELPIAEALALLDHDTELSCWYEEQGAFHQTLRQQLRNLPVPDHLKSDLLRQQHILRPPFRIGPASWLAAAAAVLLLGIIVVVRLNPTNSFETYRQRMVGNVIRQYQMDILSTNLITIREFLATNSAPSDFSLPPGLERLKPTGAGLQHWQNQPVAMVCFERTDKQMLFLFILNRQAVQDEPSASPEFLQISRLFCASWSDAKNTYLLAGTNEVGFADKYINR